MKVLEGVVLLSVSTTGLITVRLMERNLDSGQS